MARGLFRVASAPAPADEPDPGDHSCARCGRRKTWIVGPCDRAGCPGFWAWRCPTGRHGEIDDLLDVAAHGLSHDLRAREIRVEAIHSCPGCGGRDWEAGVYWAHQTITFSCRDCGEAIPVHELVLYSLEPADRGIEVARPRWDEPSRPCPCGRSKMHPDSDWIGPECVCCYGMLGYDVANWARPLCHDCQVRPPTRSPQSPGTAAWAW